MQNNSTSTNTIVDKIQNNDMILSSLQSNMLEYNKQQQTITYEQLKTSIKLMIAYQDDKSLLINQIKKFPYQLFNKHGDSCYKDISNHYKVIKQYTITLVTTLHHNKQIKKFLKQILPVELLAIINEAISQHIVHIDDDINELSIIQYNSNGIVNNNEIQQSINYDINKIIAYYEPIIKLLMGILTTSNRCFEENNTIMEIIINKIFNNIEICQSKCDHQAKKQLKQTTLKIDNEEIECMNIITNNNQNDVINDLYHMLSKNLKECNFQL